MVSLHSLGDGDIDKEGSVNEDRYSIDYNMSLTSLIDSKEYNQSMAEYNSEGEEIGNDLPPLHECYVNTPNHGNHVPHVNFEVPYETS